jgi:FkbM family methyltransferase
MAHSIPYISPDYSIFVAHLECYQLCAVVAAIHVEFAADSMSKLSECLVRAIHIYCDLECQLDQLLMTLGYRRRFLSQKGQDRWLTRRVFPARTKGYFVEVGTGNGISHSNTYILERDFDWNGILIEANPHYAAEIRNKRKALCVNACIDSKEGHADFLYYGYMSGIVDDNTDNCMMKRPVILRHNAHNITPVPTMRLDDVLAASGAPLEIDYLSIDVEGAENRVLDGISFTKFTFSAITIERPTAIIHSRLVRAGFVLDQYRYCDGFYVSAALAHELAIVPRFFVGARRKAF